MVERRSIPLRKTDLYRDTDEPLLELAKRKVQVEGGTLREALRQLRAERKDRAREIALSQAPSSQKNADGTYSRISSDPRWPFGVEDGQVVAPFGFAQYGLPRIKTLEENKAARALKSAEAKKEVRELIEDKLNALGCDPIKIMAEIALDKSVKAEVRLRAAAELSTMVYPRLRSTETQQKTETTVFVVGVPEKRVETSQEWITEIRGPTIEGSIIDVKDEEAEE